MAGDYRTPRITMRSDRPYLEAYVLRGISVRIPHPAAIPSTARNPPEMTAPVGLIVLQARSTAISQTMNNTMAVQAKVFIRTLQRVRSYDHLRCAVP